MAITLYAGIPHRRKVASFYRVENRRMEREHSARPLFAIYNHAENPAAGLQWEYARCEHGVMGDGGHCFVCNPEDSCGKRHHLRDFYGHARAEWFERAPDTITITGYEPWAYYKMHYRYAGGPSVKQVLAIGFFYLTWKRKTNDPLKPWYDLVAPNTHYPVRWFNPKRPQQRLQYFELVPQPREEWQAKVIRAVDGPDIDDLLSLKMWVELPYRRVEQKRKVYPGWTQTFLDLPMPPDLLATLCHSRTTAWDYLDHWHSRLAGRWYLDLVGRIPVTVKSEVASLPVPLPRLSPLERPPHLVQRIRRAAPPWTSTRYTICPSSEKCPKPRAADYRYTVPQVNYRARDHGFYWARKDGEIWLL